MGSEGKFRFRHQTEPCCKKRSTEKIDEGKRTSVPELYSNPRCSRIKQGGCEGRLMGQEWGDQRAVRSQPSEAPSINREKKTTIYFKGGSREDGGEVKLLSGLGGNKIFWGGGVLIAKGTSGPKGACAPAGKKKRVFLSRPKVEDTVHPGGC